MISIYLQNIETKREYPYGTSLREIAEQENVPTEYSILGALVSNKVRDMSYRIHKPVTIRFFDITSEYGMGMYSRSAYFMLYKAVRDLMPGANLKIMHSISGGKYCELENCQEPLNEKIVSRLEERMRTLTAADLPFEREELLTGEAMQIFEQHQLYEKIDLFQDRGKIFTSVYRLQDAVNYYYGFLVPSTNYVNVYKLELYENGILLKLPSRYNPLQVGITRKSPKLFSVYQSYKKWVSDIGVPYIRDINRKIENGEIEEFIQISEAFHEKQIANLADEIHRKTTIKMVLMSGPSSSGKTTTCRRLSVQLGVLGYRPVQISVDNFFVEREDTPKDEHGNYNFETIDAIDLQLFNITLNHLIQGEEVELPTFNFTTGKKEWHGKKIRMEPRSILVIEGIHCLNPRLTAQVDDAVKYKIFISALIPVSIDSQNPIPTTDNRLIRRMIRDYQFRGYSALDTIRRWASVRSGEAKYIFPYQEQADAMFNTSLICELGVLKQQAIPLLRDIPETAPEYAEARRLLKFLAFFKTIPEQSVPSGSILREFVGGSLFRY
ncbi:MAG: nucleoside kinase [Bacteroidales bacterium]|nr:nucleoside kinase [Bacteroidales bacterium]